MVSLRPRTLFGKTLATITMVSIGFQLFFLTVFLYFLLFPLGQRSAEDLAAIMYQAASEWQETSADARTTLKERLWNRYRLVIETQKQPHEASSTLLPYRYLLESSLSSLLQQPIHLLSSVDDLGDEWFWADLPAAEASVRVGFPRNRIGVHPPAAILLSLMVAIQVMLITSVLLVRRLTSPLERLSQATKRLGSGNWPEHIPEEGPEELAALAKSFNRMVTEVRELMANRTTLLAGISHDLRTPLTQIQLALAMLPERGGNSELMSGIERDMERINRLIGQFLQVSRSLERGEPERVQLDAVISPIAEQFSQQGADIEWSPCAECEVSVDLLALQRVVINLLENATRYGEGSTVLIDCRCRDGGATVQVLDRGPGIPESELEAVFQPFYRLERSRSQATGGSGLGLAIVQQLCQANGWQVKLERRSGGGTVVTLLLDRVT